MDVIGILCPSQFESRALDHPRLKKAGAVIEVSGMGKLRSMLGCFNLWEKNKNLKGILLVGFAGGLTSDLAVGDVIEPDIFIEQDYCAEPLEKFPNVIKASPRRQLFYGSRRSAMLTQDRFLTENPYRPGKAAHRPRKMAHRLGTIACDMESYAVAKFCRHKKIPFGVLKLISDVADKNAHHDFLAACRRLAPKLNRSVLIAVKAFGAN